MFLTSLQHIEKFHNNDELESKVYMTIGYFKDTLVYIIVIYIITYIAIYIGT